MNSYQGLITEQNVHGWIRKGVIELAPSNLPNSVTQIIILHFGKAEIIDIIDKKGVKSSEKQQTVTKIGNNTFYNSFGKNKILSTGKGKYKWDLKMVTSHQTWIGISSSYEVTASSFVSMTGTMCSASCLGSSCRTNDEYFKNVTMGRFGFDKKADIVTLILDLNVKQLKLLVNDDDNIACTLIDIKQGDDIK